MVYSDEKIFIILFFVSNFLCFGCARDQEIFYHGTNNFFAYYVCKGINVDRGRRALDFNSKNKGAFYLTSDFTLAKKWANIKSEIFGGEPRVISYRINKNFRNKFNVLNLKNKKEWEIFVRQSRLNINIHSYDFVEGNIFKNPYESSPAEQSGHQAAITSNILAKYFSTMIVGGCQFLSSPVKDRIIDEKNAKYVIFKDAILKTTLFNTSGTLIFRETDLKAFILIKSNHKYILQQELIKKYPLWKKYKLVPKGFIIKWQKNKKGIIRDYIAGLTLQEAMLQEKFWEPSSKQRIALISFFHNFINQGVLISQLEASNLVYSKGKWYVMETGNITEHNPPNMVRIFYNSNEDSSLKNTWIRNLSQSLSFKINKKIYENRINSLVFKIITPR